jgi:hypothetical protein
MKIKLHIICLLLCVSTGSAFGEWIQIDTQDSTIRKASRMNCFDENLLIVHWRGWDSFYNQLRISTDNGDNWRIVDIDSLGESLGLKKQEYGNISYTQIRSNSILLSLLGNKFLISKDTAKTWEIFEDKVSGYRQISSDSEGNRCFFAFYEDPWSSKHDVGFIDLKTHEIKYTALPYEFKHHSIWNMNYIDSNLIYADGIYPCEYLELVKIKSDNWESVELPKGSAGLSYLNKDIIYVYGVFNQYKFIEKSENGGETWERIFSEFYSSSDYSYGGLKMINEKVGFKWRNGREMTITKDGGYTWEPFDTPATLESLSFIDIQVIGNQAWFLTGDALYYNPDLGLE